jgi:spoIIIJ-associated protein
MNEAHKQQIESLQKSINALLERMGFSYTLEVQEGPEEVWFLIHTNNSSLLIGEGGKNLSALNHVVRRIAEKQFPEPVRFLIDINDYHKKRVEEIKDAARMHAQRVRYFKKDVEMKPMTAYERRIVHTVLQEYPDIKTESLGVGFERRVVIKPFSMVE